MTTIKQSLPPKYKEPVRSVDLVDKSGKSTGSYTVKGSTAWSNRATSGSGGRRSKVTSSSGISQQQAEQIDSQRQQQQAQQQRYDAARDALRPQQIQQSTAQNVLLQAAQKKQQDQGRYQTQPVISASKTGGYVSPPNRLISSWEATKGTISRAGKYIKGKFSSPTQRNNAEVKTFKEVFRPYRYSLKPKSEQEVIVSEKGVVTNVESFNLPFTDKSKRTTYGDLQKGIITEREKEYKEGLKNTEQDYKELYNKVYEKNPDIEGVYERPTRAEKTAEIVRDVAVIGLLKGAGSGVLAKEQLQKDPVKINLTEKQIRSGKYTIGSGLETKPSTRTELLTLTTLSSGASELLKAGKEIESLRAEEALKKTPELVKSVRIPTKKGFINLAETKAIADNALARRYAITQTVAKGTGFETKGRVITTLNYRSYFAQNPRQLITVTDILPSKGNILPSSNGITPSVVYPNTKLVGEAFTKENWLGDFKTTINLPSNAPSIKEPAIAGIVKNAEKSTFGIVDKNAKDTLYSISGKVSEAQYLKGNYQGAPFEGLKIKFPTESFGVTKIIPGSSLKTSTGSSVITGGGRSSFGGTGGGGTVTQQKLSTNFAKNVADLSSKIIPKVTVQNVNKFSSFTLPLVSSSTKQEAIQIKKEEIKQAPYLVKSVIEKVKEPVVPTKINYPKQAGSSKYITRINSSNLGKQISKIIPAEITRITNIDKVINKTPPPPVINIPKINEPIIDIPPIGGGINLFGFGRERGQGIQIRKAPKTKKINPYRDYTASLSAAFFQAKPIGVTKKQFSKLRKNVYSGLETRPIIKIVNEDSNKLKKKFKKALSI